MDLKDEKYNYLGRFKNDKFLKQGHNTFEDPGMKALESTMEHYDFRKKEKEKEEEDKEDKEDKKEGGMIGKIIGIGASLLA